MPAARVPRAPATEGLAPRTSAFLWCAAILLFAFCCYWPLTRFFLAQDDFSLLERASHGFGEAMSPFFRFAPGQFRPLSKGLYFWLAWPMFGLNPLPYHIVSIVLHAIDAILVGAVLRRLGISRLTSWLVAFVFVAHLCHIEAVAWASCVQQLMGGLFGFAALIFGLDALASDRRRRPAILATVAYALALASYEQTLAVPFVLVLWQWLRKGPREAFRGGRVLAAMWLVLVVYAVYAFILRGMPESGPYVMHIGTNVIQNLMDYTGLALSVWHIYPAYALLSGYRGALLAWTGIILLHLLARSYRDLVFGLVTFFAFLAPVMFTTAHTHSFHLYLPEIGVSFLLASLVDSVRRFAGVRSPRTTAAVLVCAVAVLMAGSVAAVRRNVAATLAPEIPLPRIFVLRRAILAERLCYDIKSKWDATASRLVMVYPVPDGAAANWRNAQAAVGNGSAIRLMLARPKLEVVFVPPAKMPESIDPAETMVFTEFGSVFTVAEWQKIRDRVMIDTDPSGN